MFYWKLAPKTEEFKTLCIIIDAQLLLPRTQALMRLFPSLLGYTFSIGLFDFSDSILESEERLEIDLWHFPKDLSQKRGASRGMNRQGSGRWVRQSQWCNGNGSREFHRLKVQRHLPGLLTSPTPKRGGWGRRRMKQKSAPGRGAVTLLWNWSTSLTMDSMCTIHILLYSF